jgi:hypothetical protein
MMDPNTIAIPIAFIILSAVLCWLVISLKGKWWIKLILILIVPSFGLAVWKSLSSYQGWPTSTEIPEKALFLQGIVREPEPDDGDPGAIYLWLLPLSPEVLDVKTFLDFRGKLGEPRAYKLPYSRGMHQAVLKAQSMAAKGKPAVMQRGGKPGKGDGDGDGTPGEEGQREGLDGQPGRPGDGYGGHEQDVQVYELPDPEPPRKDAE